MDGAINMNPSNAPQVLSSSETKKIEKSVGKEAVADEKNVAQVLKALRSAEKNESKVEKVIQKAQRAYDKAAKQEHKTAQALGEARHKHDVALAGENKAEYDLSMRQKHLQEAHRTVERRRTELEQAQSRKDSRDVDREERLHKIQRDTTSGTTELTST